LASAIAEDDVALLVEDPATAIELLYGVEVMVRDIADSASACSVAGEYDPGPPPVIKIGRALSSGRTRFTALHELGHHLCHYDSAIQDWHWDSPTETGEEVVANEFAGGLLVPAPLVDECIDDAGPTGYAVAELFERSPASRAACCVRAARRIPGSGAVAVARDGTIRFASARGLPFAIRQDLPQDEGSWLDRVTQAEGHHRHDQVRIRFRSGNLSSPLFGDAYTVDGYAFLVLVEHSPPWGGLSIRDANDGPVGGDVECPYCERTFEDVWKAPCRKCGDRPCPSCGRCSCEPVRPAARKCVECFIDLPRATPPGVNRCEIHQ
jgi:hypothetical protein